MNLGAHHLGETVFRALAAGGGGAAVRDLASAQHSRHILLIRGVVDAAAGAGHPQAARVRRAYDLLADVQAHAPAEAEAVIRHPGTGAWARRTLRALHAGAAAPDGGSPQRAPAVPEGLAAVAAAAAIRAGFAAVIEVPLHEGTVVLPTLGRAVPVPGGDGDRAVVRVTPRGEAEIMGGDGRVRVPADHRTDAPGWHGVRRLSAEAGGTGIKLLLDDVDAHCLPAATTTAGRLTEAEAGNWRTLLDGAWELLVKHHWTVAAEIGEIVRVLAPLAPPASGQVSVSSRETFGCVALSTPEDDRVLAVTLAHEVQHAKLTALLDLVPLTLPDTGARYYAPWRDDPRPVSGLLQGVYAHLGVAGFWRRQRLHEYGNSAIRANAEFARWRDAAAEAVRTLTASGALTPEGTAFVSAMGRTLAGWCGEPVPDTALGLARRAAERHRRDWRLRNGSP
ncbi:HEXXH motif domain-containing protein [Streptosporangium sp. NPDC004379]|uniref:HEXXH motif domain-containing protein n=1 Tax=Streptosporangium sp. NPDC004379 TaxID=3366189 RepID=UPI0036B77199